MNNKLVSISAEDKIKMLQQELRLLRHEYSQLKEQYDAVNTAYQTVVHSSSWKATLPIRRVLDYMKGVKVHDSEGRIESALPTERCLQLAGVKKIDIITPNHTIFAARMMQKMLTEAGIHSKVHDICFTDFEQIPYIVFCPQAAEQLPDVYVAFQLEQTVSNRWFTDEYTQILKNAYAVFDYSLKNIDFFRSNKTVFKHLYYLPMRPSLDICNFSQEKKYDVIFYGDASSERRTKILQKLSEHFQVKIVSEVFETEVYDYLRQAKILVNIHYYEGAVLETTKIAEALSNSDCLIVSEYSADAEEDEKYSSVIDFTEEGNTEELIKRIGYWLEHDELRTEKVRINKEIAAGLENEFQFYFHRFLLANGLMSFESFYQKEKDFFQFAGNKICLNLPESTERRKHFKEYSAEEFQFFPALKHDVGWLGCAMSYKFLAMKALESNLEQLTICEDDVLLPEDYSNRIRQIEAFLSNKNWDIFSGFMSNVGNVTISEINRMGGELFVHLDKMISTVYNIYSKKGLHEMSKWDYSNMDVSTNTIDRYLERMNLNIITTSPFLVGHVEELGSDVWNRSSAGYTEMIRNSEEKLQMLISKFENENPDSSAT